MKRISIILALVVNLLVTPSSPATASDNFDKNLNLASPVSAVVGSSTVEVQLQASKYPSEYRYEEMVVCVTNSSGCGGYNDLNPLGITNIKINSDYNGKRVSVLAVNENKYFFNFSTLGKFQILLSKRYSKDVPGRSVRDSFYSSVTIPVEITDTSKGGFDVTDLAAAGVEINPIPVLKCPEKIKNIKQTISCEIAYGFKDPEYDVLFEPFETFKICAYKNNEIDDECLGKTYFNKEIRINLNTSLQIKIPIFKNVDTNIEIVPVLRGKDKYYDDIFASQSYFYKPVKKSSESTGKTGSGKWVKKCRTVTSREIPLPGELTDSILNGGGGPRTTQTQICENVWVP